MALASGSTQSRASEQVILQHFPTRAMVEGAARFFRLRIDMFWYRPYDAAVRANGKLVYSDRPVPWSTRRVFREAEGKRLVYEFVDDADHASDIETLTRQVRVVVRATLAQEERDQPVRTPEQIATFETWMREQSEAIEHARLKLDRTARSTNPRYK